MKYQDQCKRWNAEYYRYIYDQLLNEIEEVEELGLSASAPKWKRDLLLMLLEEASRPTTVRKVLRKKVADDIEAAQRRGWKCYEKSEGKN